MVSNEFAKGLDGIITPAITPFDNRKIDYEAIAKLNSFVGSEGVKAVFPAGSTGCFSFMTLDEHKTAIGYFSETISKGVKLLPGVGRNSIAETLEMARFAEKSEAYALVIVTPYYIKLNDETLFHYFDSIASKVEGNIILYNIPQFTGKRISADVALKLANKHKNIVGIKDSSGDFRSFVGYTMEMPKGFLVFQGQDDLLLPSLELGAAGGVCGTTNFTDIAVRVYNEHAKGATKSAKALQERLTKIMKSVNSVQFPTGYNYMFYRRVMKRNATNAIEPFKSLGKSEMKFIDKKIKTLESVK